MGLRDRLRKRLGRDTERDKPSSPAPTKKKKAPIKPPGFAAAPEVQAESDEARQAREAAAARAEAQARAAEEAKAAAEAEAAAEIRAAEVKAAAEAEEAAKAAEAAQAKATEAAKPRKFKLSDFDTADAPKLSDHAGKVSHATGEGPTHSVRVHNDVEGIDWTFEVEEGEYILDAAERHGLDLPYSCRAGGCLVCSGRITAGDAETVEMDEDQYVLEEEDIEQGFILLCCTTVKGDVHFLTHQQDNVQEI